MPLTPSELATIFRRHSGVAIGMGVVCLLVGLLALAAPLAAGLSITLAIGVLLAIAGVAQLVLALRAGAFGRALPLFLMGALSIIVGLYVLSQPAVGLASITLFLGAYFVVEGIFEVVWSFQLRPLGGWGWTLFSGVVALLLGLAIWSQFPFSGSWAVGVLAGIKLLFTGIWLITMGSSVRRTVVVHHTP